MLSIGRLKFALQVPVGKASNVIDGQGVAKVTNSELSESCVV
jgi:hypothetical protein